MTIVKFFDPDEGAIHYGILYNNIVICGCCGGTFEIEEIEILDQFKYDFESYLAALLE